MGGMRTERRIDRVPPQFGVTMNPDPIELFQQWYTQEVELTTARLPSACCLSTLGTDGFPNARFLAFKGLSSGALVVTGNLRARKGVELLQCPRVALTFWWPFTERQVRIQGMAHRIPDPMADTLFAQRSRESQIVSIVSRQGEVLPNQQELTQAYQDFDASHHGQELQRPAHWGGYAIDPVRIEFLEFNASRFHQRSLFERLAGSWELKTLQP